MNETRAPRPTILAWVPVWGIAAVAIVLGWPGVGLRPMAGLDPSWIMGLHLAGDAGLHLGNDIVFTFGPLGPLTRPVLIDAGAFLPGLVVRFAAIAATAALVASHARRLLGAKLGIPVALVLVPFLVLPYGRGADPEVAVVLYVVWLLAGLRREPAPWLVPAGLLGAALLLFAKVSSGITALVLWALWAGGLAWVWTRLPRPADQPSPARWAWPWLLAAPPLLVVAALPFGFSPGQFGAYLGNSLELTLGFAAGMHDAHHRTLLHLGVFALALVPLVAAMGARIRAAGRDRADRSTLLAELAGALLVAAFTFTRFKYGFTREGPGHLVPAVGSLLLLALVVAPTAWRARPRLAWSSIGAGFVALLVVLEPSGAQPWNVLANARAWGDDLVSFVSSEDNDRRAELLADLGITDAVVPPPGTVHVDPWDIGVVWALGRVEDWSPPPVFQSYSAYTVHLDDLNAVHLAGPSAPDWVLRQPKMIDRRNPAWDPPRHLLALACNYDEVATAAVPADARLQGPPWTLLARRAEPRCDALAQPSSDVSFDTVLGQWFDRPVPACGDRLTTWSVEVDPGGPGAQLRTLGWVPPVFEVEADLGDGDVARWRWLPAFSGEPMLLDAPGDARWALRGSSTRIARLRVLRADDTLQGSDVVTVTAGCL